MSEFIKIRNLVKQYKLKNGMEFNAVNDVDLDIEKGDVYGIMGLSGAGKSTLVRLINRLEEPTSGKIIVNGKNVLEYDQKQLREFRKKTGMIFQHFNLLNSRNVASNIAFPLEISGWKKADITKRVDELLEIVGLVDKKENYPEQLSGGQKQRVAIARALALQPDIMLFDEPTSALDPELVKEVLDIIRKLKSQKITMLIVSHEMKFVREISDRVIIMEEGEILETGTSKQIFENPSSQRVREFLNANK